VIIFVGITHAAVPLAVYITLARHTNINFNLFIAVIILVFSILPDVDHPNSKIVRKFPLLAFISIPINLIAGHRGAVHSLLFAFIFSVPLLLIDNKIYFLAAFLSYNSHLLMDLLTKTPIPIFYPMERRISLKLFKTNGPEEYILALICIVLIFYPEIL